MQVSNTGFALVEDRTSKNGRTGDVQHDLGKALRCLKETVSLKSRDRGQSINRVGFRYRHDIIWVRIDAKFALVEILHHESITQLGDVNDSVNVAREIGAVFESDAVTGAPDITTWHRRLIYIRVLIVDEIRPEVEIAAVVFSVIHLRIKSDGRAASRPVIQPHPAFDFIGDWKRDLAQERRSPGAQVSGRDTETEGIVQRLIEIGPPEDGDLANIKSYVLENHAIVLVNARFVCVEMKIGIGRIICREIAILDHRVAVRKVRKFHT